MWGKISKESVALVIIYPIENVSILFYFYLQGLSYWNAQNKSLRMEHQAMKKVSVSSLAMDIWLMTLEFGKK